MLKAGAGLIAGVVAGGLGYCFWPRVEPSVLASRPAVQKPVFVVATTAPAPAPVNTPAAPAVVAVTEPTVAAKEELEKLAAALKAHPPESRGVLLSPVESAPTPAAPAPSEEAAKFCAEGLVALAAGDIATARLFLKRAADAGDARALMALGDTYDAPTLARLGVVGMHGDSDRAHDFYARALAAGVDAAKERIAALEARRN
jgi:hypothetical protein